MKLNALEKTFFEQILNAELDVPVPATLSFGKHTFEVIIVPEINPDGYFILKYFNTPAYKPEPQASEGSAPAVTLSHDEACGQHPAFRQAWLQEEPVTVNLRPTISLRDRTFFQRTVIPKLDGRVQFADTGHRGRLRLENNQVAVRKSKLKRAEFCIVGFPDFVTSGRLLKTSEADEWFKSLECMVNQLNEGASINLERHFRVVLDTQDGWKVTLTKDKELTRDQISHTGVIERIDGNSYEPSELSEVLDGLKAFFGFTAGRWCHPTVVIGFEGDTQPVWGRIGRFDTVRQPLPNWFRNDRNAPDGSNLEALFPLFWCRWRQKKDEVTAIVKCYVHSNSMQRAGFSEDAVAKSYAGLEMLAGLMLGNTVYGNSHKEIGKVLDTQIPHHSLDASKTPSLAKLYDNLQLDKDSNGNCLGLNLLNAVRNYVIHPLDKDKLPSIKAEYLKHLDADYMHYVFLHDLCQYYLEYMFLDYCNFDVAIAGLHYRALIEERNLK